MASVWMPQSVCYNDNAKFVYCAQISFADMSPDDIRAIFSKLSRRPTYVTQEVVDTDGSIGSQYTGIGDVQEYVLAFSHMALPYHPSDGDDRFRYPGALQAAFNGGGIAGLKGIENRGKFGRSIFARSCWVFILTLLGWLQSNTANVFVVSNSSPRNNPIFI